MKLLIKFSYSNFALDILPDTNISALIAGVSQLKEYSETGYGDSRRFTEKRDTEIGVSIIDDSLFSDKQDSSIKEMLDRIESLKDSTSKAQLEAASNKRELEGIKKKISLLGIQLDSE